MTVDEALEALELTRGATDEEIDRAHQRLAVEHGIRVANAPTPEYREHYARLLGLVEEAREGLLGHLDSNGDVHYLNGRIVGR